jgi:glucosyltransferase
MPLISIVVPCYNEQESLEIFYEEISRVLGTMGDVESELLLVDDGSSDGTLEVIRRLRAIDPRVRFVSFSRNFGKEAAILAGLRHARGDYVALLDADLQDPPSLLPDMYAAVSSGQWDCAAARRTSRTGESRIRSVFATAFYRLFSAISQTPLVNGARDFRIMSRQMVDALLELCEVNRFSKGLFSWVGFRTVWLDYENVERRAGTTKWSFLQLARYSIDGLVDFSTAPLALASAFGFLLCLAAILGVLFIVIRKLAFGDPVEGWSSLACIILFVGGVQSFSIGIVGEYLSRTYLETKHRPVYVVRETEE